MFVQKEASREEMVLAVQGPLSGETTVEFHTRMEELCAGRYLTITLDFSQTPSINSSALGKILLFRKKLAEGGLYAADSGLQRFPFQNVPDDQVRQARDHQEVTRKVSGRALFRQKENHVPETKLLGKPVHGLLDEGRRRSDGQPSPGDAVEHGEAGVQEELPKGAAGEKHQVIGNGGPPARPGRALPESRRRWGS